MIIYLKKMIANFLILINVGFCFLAKFHTIIFKSFEGFCNN